MKTESSIKQIVEDFKKMTPEKQAKFQEYIVKLFFKNINIPAGYNPSFILMSLHIKRIRLEIKRIEYKFEKLIKYLDEDILGEKK